MVLHNEVTDTTLEIGAQAGQAMIAVRMPHWDACCWFLDETECQEAIGALQEALEEIRRPAAAPEE